MPWPASRKKRRACSCGWTYSASGVDMAIYKMVGDKEKLDEVAQTSFGQEGVLERSDLQRMLRDQPEVLEEGLLIIAEEFGDWKDSNRRIDLLGLDASGRLAVIELKRGETGSHMDLQAIRYAAMVANMTNEKAIETYQSYLDERSREKSETEEADDAETLIRQHLKAEGETPDIRTETPRIILVSENFSKELTTCVIWLNESWLRTEGQEIKCIRLQPHRNGDEILIETSVVIPLPEASDYQIGLARRKEEARVQKAIEQSSGRSRHIPGKDAFRENIIRAQEKFQPGLSRLYDCAVDLEEKELVALTTYMNAKQDYIRLELRVPGESDLLVSFNNLLYKGGKGGGISFWPHREGIAAKSLSRIDDLIGPSTSTSGFRHRMLSVKKTADNLEEILAAIGDVYREAEGQRQAGGGGSCW